MFIIFRCRCGRHLYAEEAAKSRACPCGRRINTKNAVVLAKAGDAFSAGEIVRSLQLGGREMHGFSPAAMR
jgi:hypothetical protein